MRNPNKHLQRLLTPLTKIRSSLRPHAILIFRTQMQLERCNLNFRLNFKTMNFIVMISQLSIIGAIRGFPRANYTISITVNIRSTYLSLGKSVKNPVHCFKTLTLIRFQRFDRPSDPRTVIHVICMSNNEKILTTSALEISRGNTALFCLLVTCHMITCFFFVFFLIAGGSQCTQRVRCARGELQSSRVCGGELAQASCVRLSLLQATGSLPSPSPRRLPVSQPKRFPCRISCCMATV